MFLLIIVHFNKLIFGYFFTIYANVYSQGLYYTNLSVIIYFISIYSFGLGFSLISWYSKKDFEFDIYKSIRISLLAIFYFLLLFPIIIYLIYPSISYNIGTIVLVTLPFLAYSIIILFNLKDRVVYWSNLKIIFVGIGILIVIFYLNIFLSSFLQPDA